MDNKFQNNQIELKIQVLYEEKFTPLISLFENDPELFITAKKRIFPLITESNGIQFIDALEMKKLVAFLDVYFYKGAVNDLYSFYMNNTHSDVASLGNLPLKLQESITEFSSFLGPCVKASQEVRQQKEKDFALAIKTLKESMMSRPLKKFMILKDWLLKWSIYLIKESDFSPKELKSYKQGEVILVDFGFNIGAELGGRHYAVVLEKNNNPNASVILVAPISSYDPQKGQHAHPASVDLGIGAIHHYTKGSQVVLNQVRYISKMRIERPKTTLEKRDYIDHLKLQEVLSKVRQKLSYKQQNTNKS